MIAGSSLRDLHDAFSWVVVIGNGVAGVWALGAHAVPTLRTRWLWYFTAAAQVTVAAQVCLGAALVAGQGVEAPEFHAFYGFLTLIAVTLLYAYRAQLRDRLYLLYGGGGLFLTGLALRAMTLTA